VRSFVISVFMYAFRCCAIELIMSVFLCVLYVCISLVCYVWVRSLVLYGVFSGVCQQLFL